MFIHMFTIFGSLAQAAMLDYVIDNIAELNLAQSNYRLEFEDKH